jgi:hypothetical protein
MHQEHNIPWNTLASHFQFIHDNRHYTPRTNTGIFTRNLPQQTSHLQHFVRTFSNAIDTFARTERAKYPTSFPAPISGQVFTDDLRNKYPDFLNESNQRIENWISCARLYNSYSTSQGSLADVVKILIHENQLSTLLMLAQHPDIPLHQLCHLSWGHHFGFSRIMESSLQAYIFFNLATAMGILEDGRYKELDCYPRLVGYLNDSMDYDGQQVPHRKFFDQYRAPGGEQGKSPAVHQDLPRLKQYMKDLFAMIYRFDVVMKECGLDPKWDYEIPGALDMIVLGQHWYFLMQK